MATTRITKRSVDDAIPGFLWDPELRGFGLKVGASGSKSYVFQYRMGGRASQTKRITIGSHGSPWNPATARKEAERLSLLVKQGTDPHAQKLEQRREAVELAFSAYASNFLERYVRSSWSGSFDYAESILRLHVCPILGDKPLPTIVKADVTAVLDRIPVRSVALRRNVYSVVRRLFTWAVGRGDIDRSPLEGFEAPPSVRSRERVLTDKELALVWRAAGTLEYPFGPMIHFLILSGQRREEVASLDWRELDQDAGEWRLPPERTKNGRLQIVPISNGLRKLIDQLARADRWPRRGLLFTTTGKTSVSGYSRAKRRLDAAVAALAGDEELLEPWRVHDLRRTLATGLQRLGVRFEVTEAVLNHVGGAKGGIAGVYQRHDWAAEKRAALNAWASHVEALLEERPARDNVLVLPRSA